MAAPQWTVMPAAEVDDADWDRLCRRWGWFWQTSGWREYTVAYAGERRCVDRSFALMHGEELVAAVPLLITEADGELQGRGPDGPCWSPVVSRDGSDPLALLRAALDESVEICARSGARTLELQLSPLTPHHPEVLADLLAVSAERGAVDATIVSSVVDLSGGEEQRRRALSQSHRRAVTKGLRALRVAAETSSEAFTVYRALHLEAAGRQTRPERTWTLMAEWVERGDARLYLARQDGVAVGGVLVLVSGERAYYASGANRPAIAERLPVAHAIHWTAMSDLASVGISSYEVGVVAPAHGAKEQGIATFKRRFGGVPRPLLRRILPVAA